MHKLSICALVAPALLLACAQADTSVGGGPGADTAPLDDSTVPVDTSIADAPVADGDARPVDAADGSTTDSKSGDVADVLVDARDAVTDGDAIASDTADGTAVDAPSTAAIVLLGCNGTPGTLVQARYATATGWTTIGSAGGSCTGAPAVARLSDGAIAIARGSDNGIYTSRYGATSWGAFTRLYGATTIVDRPFLTSTGFGAILSVLDSANIHSSATYDGSIWEAALEKLPGGTAGAFGPTTMSIGAAASSQVAIYRGSDTFLYNAVRSGTWGASTQLGTTVFTNNTTLSPVVVATGTTAPDLEVFYVGGAAGDNKIRMSSRSATVWSGSSLVAPGTSDASTIKQLAAIKTSGGAIVLVFVGTDNRAYAMIQSTPGTAFTTAAPIDPSADVNAVALTPGIGGDDAMVIMGTTATGVVRWSKLKGTTWSSALLVSGGSMEWPAVTTTP
jgi:hypothetical protein